MRTLSPALLLPKHLYLCAGFKVLFTLAFAFLTAGAGLSGESDLLAADSEPLDAESAKAAIEISGWDGEDRDLTYPITYVFTRQLVGLGVLTTMDKETTLFDSFSFDTFKDGFRSAPTWDDDEWYWNYVAHPLWGSETFLRARSQNFTFFESFLFSTASSVVWEYGMENWTSHPSQQDLMFTSTIGSLIGEIRYKVLKKLAPFDTRKAKTLRFLVDPLQCSTRFVGGWFGFDWEEPAWQVAPMVGEDGSVGVHASFSTKF